jgi:hypothetical protein
MPSAGKVIIDHTGRVLSRHSGPRHRGGRALPGAIPSLQEFIHKQTVLRQYRHYLKAVALVEDQDHRQQARQEIKINFRRDSMETDSLSIQMAVKDGERRLAQVQSLVGYTVHQDEDSWLNIKDAEDPRGRVGNDWPWQR